MRRMIVCKQKCIITNKAQLLAAVGCAFDFEGDTEIILNRKSGTTKIKLHPIYFSSQFEKYHESLPYWAKQKNYEMLRKLRSNIRKTPAKCFK